MAFWDNIKFGGGSRRDKSVESPTGTLTEDTLWKMFVEAMEDGSLSEALSSGGPLGSNVQNRLSNYKKLGDHEVNSGYLAISRLRRYIELGWSLYDFDPILRQGIDSRALYTFGQGITMSTRKRSSWGQQLGKVIDAFWFDPCNFNQFSSTEALISLDVQLQIEGNVMLFLWKDKMSGMMQVRPLKTTWIEQVVVGSGDGAPSGKVVGYVINLADGQLVQNDIGYGGGYNRPKNEKRVAYADINSEPKDLRGLVGEIDIETEGRIAHLKSWGRPWMGIGVPPILAAMDPSQRYGQYLEDWSIVQGLFRTFALSVVSKGTNKGVHDVVKKYRDNMQSSTELYNPALSSSDGGGYDGSPVAHTMFTGMGPGGNPGSKIEAIKTAGATEGPDKARELKLQACAAFGLPETMFGDAKVGNHATAHTLERTVDLRAHANQMIWSDFIESVLKYVARESDYGHMGTDAIDIGITFPVIVEHVISDHVDAIVDLFKAGLITDFIATRQALHALHVPDTEEVLRRMFPDTDSYGTKRTADDILKAQTDEKTAQITADSVVAAAKEQGKAAQVRASSTSSS